MKRNIKAKYQLFSFSMSRRVNNQIWRSELPAEQMPTESDPSPFSDVSPWWNLYPHLEVNGWKEG
jgi:hypothetical protein